MRDLTRPNAKHPAYAMLAGEGIRFFTPMTWKIYTFGGRRERRWVPVMHDLLFVYSSRDVIDPIVERVSTFQYSASFVPSMCRRRRNISVPTR